jgi:hypothetical protein
VLDWLLEDGGGDNKVESRCGKIAPYSKPEEGAGEAERAVQLLVAVAVPVIRQDQLQDWLANRT